MLAGSCTYIPACRYDKVDPFDGTDRWAQNRRVLSVRVTADGGSSTLIQLNDTRARQNGSHPVSGEYPDLAC